jgi:low temperature requirement protein LtrA
VLRRERERGQGGQRVTSIELFFDLVYVLAVTQLSHLLLEHLDARGAAQTALLLAAAATLVVAAVAVSDTRMARARTSSPG